MNWTARAEIEPIEPGPWSRLRHWWPPARPRALARRIAKIVITLVAVGFVGVAIFVTMGWGAF